MKANKFTERFKNINPDTKELVKKNLDILDRINFLLENKFDGKQRLLAEKMGKSEPEVSKMINGFQNFTIKTIQKLEKAFEAPILAVCTDHEANSTFQLVMPCTYIPQENLVVYDGGQLKKEISLKEENISFSS
jgi:transcriptional regulator with XRE-family HTH domain